MPPLVTPTLVTPLGRYVGCILTIRTRPTRINENKSSHERDYLQDFFYLLQVFSLPRFADPPVTKFLRCYRQTSRQSSEMACSAGFRSSLIEGTRLFDHPIQNIDGPASGVRQPCLLTLQDIGPSLSTFVIKFRNHGTTRISLIMARTIEGRR